MKSGRPMSNRVLVLGMLAAFVAIQAFMAADTTSARGRRGPEPRPMPAEYDDGEGDMVVIEVFDIDGNSLSTKAFDKDGRQVPAFSSYHTRLPRNVGGCPGISEAASSDGDEPKTALVTSQEALGASTMAIGFSGSPSSSGCRSRTISNRVPTTLGFTLLRFNTSTYWCWNLSTHTVYNVRTSEWISDVDSVVNWKGLIADTNYYYPYVRGYSKSGHKSHKQGKAQLCSPIKIPFIWNCYAWIYPQNWHWVFEDGTWAWDTRD